VDAVDAETVEAEAAHTETEEAPKAEKEPKSANRWEEYEHKLKDLVSTAISKLNFTRNDDHTRLEARIAALEEKLSHLAELVSEQGGNNKGQ
jgi:polyhydroxyalkanoate synthesis regulator phasin